jgi:DNA-directed RNA polymerase II subunit RPB9
MLQRHFLCTCELPFDFAAQHSAVFFQDQSKRKETRMILFFVCARCNHTFVDPSLPTENRPDAGGDDDDRDANAQ